MFNNDKKDTKLLCRILYSYGFTDIVRGKKPLDDEHPERTLLRQMPMLEEALATLKDIPHDFFEASWCEEAWRKENPTQDFDYLAAKRREEMRHARRDISMTITITMTTIFAKILGWGYLLFDHPFDDPVKRWELEVRCLIKLSKAYLKGLADYRARYG